MPCRLRFYSRCVYVLLVWIKMVIFIDKLVILSILFKSAPHGIKQADDSLSFEGLILSRIWKYSKVSNDWIRSDSLMIRKINSCPKGRFRSGWQQPAATLRALSVWNNCKLLNTLKPVSFEKLEKFVLPPLCAFERSWPLRRGQHHSQAAMSARRQPRSALPAADNLLPLPFAANLMWIGP